MTSAVLIDRAAQQEVILMRAKRAEDLLVRHAVRTDHGDYVTQKQILWPLRGHQDDT